MRLSHWLRSARSRPVPADRPRPARPPQPGRLRVEPLEDRSVPAAFTVSNLADAGPGSLRAAIVAANANPGTDVIDFAPTLKGTVALTSGELGLTDDVLIDGPGAKRLAVSGSDLSRVFRIDAGVTANIDGLTVTRGNAEFRGGGILNDGTLTLSDAVVSDNVVVGLPGDLPAVNSFGGGIFNTGTLTVLHTTFAGNRAVGADGVTGVSSSGALGGAIMSFGLAGAPASATISHCAFLGNLAKAGDAAPGAAASNALGGGIVNGNGAMTISGSLFRDNRAVGGLGSSLGGGFAAGGAINNNARVGDATLVVSNSTLINNRATGGATATGTGGIGRGGGISNLVAFRAGPGPVLSATATITGSILSGNRAVGGAGTIGGLGLGGGLANENGGALTVTDSAILLNRAVGGAGVGSGGSGLGGGIFNSPPGPAGAPRLALQRSLVALNRAVGGESDGGTDGQGVGGGLYIAPGGEASADEATAVWFNSASTSDDDVFGSLNTRP